ncbi:MAG: hypothetical protein IJS17_06660 [Clostridia bacterium]|nr:hypothetical protein [Clostridia bacterium]
MNNESVKEALKFFKKTVYLSKLLRAVSALEKAVLISAAVITVGEMIMLIKKIK